MWIWLAAVAFAVGVSVYYLKTAALKPELHFEDNPGNREVLDRIPALTQRVWITPWMFSGPLQLLWLGLRKGFGRPVRYDRVDTLSMPDGGTTALNWLDGSAAPETPVIAILHTITGSPHSMRGLVRDLQRQTGWRIVVCQRRGHGDLRLTSANFNTMGNVEDLRCHVAEIQQQFPEAPLFMMGVSAGTGLLTRYLAEQGSDTPVRAAFSYCPGYDIDVAFSRANPWLSRKMARKLIRQFLLPNRSVLEQIAGYRELANAQSLQEFQDRLPKFAGYETREAYLAGCNPMHGMERITVPAIVLNAEDDPVCVVRNVREHQATLKQLGNLILVVTRRGTHCAHFSGLLPRPWAHDLAGSYFLAMHERNRSG